MIEKVDVKVIDANAFSKMLQRHLLGILDQDLEYIDVKELSSQPHNKSSTISAFIIDEETVVVSIESGSRVVECHIKHALAMYRQQSILTHIFIKALKEDFCFACLDTRITPWSD